LVNRTLRENVFNPANGDRPDFPNIAIVITDGQSNRNESGTQPAAQLLRNVVDDVFVIGITDEIDHAELRVWFFVSLKEHEGRLLTVTYLSICWFV